MLAKGRESARLAADHNLRPYNDPMDGAAMNAWLLERIILRLENYRTAEENLTRVINVTFPAIVGIARRVSRSRGLLDRLHYWKKSVLGTMMVVEHMLYVVKQIIHNNYSIVGRNLLLADEHKDRMQGWKQNLNRVTKGWTMLRDALDHDFRDDTRVDFPKLSALFKDMVTATRKLKYEMKQLRILHASNDDMLAIADVRAYRQITHPKFRIQSEVSQRIVDLRKWYLTQYRQGLDYTDRAFTLHKAEIYINDVVLEEVQKVERCLQFIWISRVSREYNYQKWSISAPKPVLPEYVRKAVERHREQFGAQSIY